MEKNRINVSIIEIVRLKASGFRDAKYYIYGCGQLFASEKVTELRRRLLNLTTTLQTFIFWKYAF